MESSPGLTFLFGLGIMIWLAFLFVVGVVAWKDPRWDRAKKDKRVREGTEG